MVGTRSARGAEVKHFVPFAIATVTMLRPFLMLSLAAANPTCRDEALPDIHALFQMQKVQSRHVSKHENVSKHDNHAGVSATAFLSEVQAMAVTLQQKPARPNPAVPSRMADRRWNRSKRLRTFDGQHCFEGGLHCSGA